MAGEIPLLELDHVTFTYPAHGGQPAQPVLSDISLQIRANEYVAIIGQNGSGKSTLAKLLNGLLRPSSGSVRVNGMDTAQKRNLTEIRTEVGMVFQHPDNQMVATIVEEDVAFGLENLCVPQDEMRQRVTQALRQVGMETHRNRPPHQLSGGQKQRVAIAAVIAMQPRCIVFDEATSMLDASGRADVLQLMSRLHDQGLTIVTITHDMEEALHANRVVALQGGRVALDGPPQSVFSQVETLRSMHLDVPIAADVAYRLRRDRVFKHNLDMPILTAKEFAAVFAAEMVEQCGERQPEGAAVQVERSQHHVILGPPEEDQCLLDSAGRGTLGDEPRRAMIEVTELEHTYMADTPLEQHALFGVSLKIYEGEIAAVVGHTGSGKSTLIQHLNGLMIPQRGTVEVDGIMVRDRRDVLKQVRSSVGIVFQNPEDQVFEALIGDDIAYGPFQFGLSLDEVRARVRYAMDIVGLDFEWRDRSTYALSGGQKRKVALAGVIALKPKVLVLDEPTAGLDPLSRDALLANIKRLNQEQGTTVVIVTHRMEEVAQLAHRLLVFDSGRLVLQGTPRQIFSDRSRLTQLHLNVPDTVALLDEFVERGIALDPLQLTRQAVYRELRSLMDRKSNGGLHD